MFEGNPPKPLQGADFGGSAGETESLRPLTWSALRARLDAARDLRASFHESDEDGPASFDTHSARRIAALGEGKQAVNPRNSGNGKSTGGIDGSAPDNAAASARGIQ